MVGLGYRKEFAKKLIESTQIRPDFIEVAPENWMGIGGFWKQQFSKAREQYPLYLHGLSLSIGSPEGVDVSFVKQLKQFLDEVQPEIYSEHLSFSKVQNAHLYDLLPIPFTKQAINQVVENILQVQDILGRQIALENSSYYTVLQQEMPEHEFITEIYTKADCHMLLDINNVYVNSFNHGYDAKEFIQNLPLERVKYIHMAGHTQVSDTLIIDTHGNNIINPVFELYEFAVETLGRDVPTLLERDFNIPELTILGQEIQQLREIKTRALSKAK